MHHQLQSGAIIPLFVLMICSAKGEPIVLSVGGGPAPSYGGSTSTIILASAPATIAITAATIGLGGFLFGAGPTITEDLDFSPLGGGQGLFDPAHASYTSETFGFGPPSASAFCGGSFVGDYPVVGVGGFSCTETIGPGLYALSISLTVMPNIVFSMPTTGDFQATVTAIGGGPIGVAPEPASLVLCATGTGLFIAIARIRRRPGRRSAEHTRVLLA